ncbi:hypothetical protein GF352_03320 [archaeon]|nr:hypothetical protein [archaeon]
MGKVSINDLKRKYGAVDDEFLHEAQLLIIMFNFWPEVQQKWLKKLDFKPEEINKVLKISDLYAQKKIELMNEKLPVNRRGVILIENDVMELLYKPRALIVSDSSKAEALKVLEEYLEDKHPGAVLVNHQQIDKLEDLMNLEGRSVDFLVFTDKEIISYQVELKD